VTDLAIFAATSGHSGVDRVLGNLVPAIAARGLAIDVLGIEGHGPHWPALPEGVRRVALGARHVNSAIPALVNYLRQQDPSALLTDKDRVNRAAIVARWLAGSRCRLGVRLGTTVSVNLASRGRFDRWLQTQSMRRLYPKADAVLVPSMGAAEDLARFAGLRRGHVRVVPSPIVTSQMAERARQPVDHPWFSDGGAPVILGVGELSERKDFATLVKAHAMLVKAHPCRLLILGEGRRRRELEDLATHLGTRALIDLPGFKSNPYPYMANAALFALSSRWEGMPVVLVEALALGTPAVACDCPSGPRELLQDGALGPLVPVGDVSALREALKQTLDHPRPRDQLIAGVQRYTADNSARAYLEALGFRVGTAGNG
jgi:glycosyltransferase involved in cell wall biosynthesis